MLKPLLPDETKINTTSDDIRLRSNFNSNKTIKLTKFRFLQKIRLYSITPRSIERSPAGYFQKIAGTYKSEKTINLNGIVKFLFKWHCISDSIVAGVRKPNLFNFALHKPPGQEVHKERRIPLPQKCK